MAEKSKKTEVSKRPQNYRMPSPEEFRCWLEDLLREAGLKPAQPKSEKE